MTGFADHAPAGGSPLSPPTLLVRTGHPGHRAPLLTAHEIPYHLVTWSPGHLVTWSPGNPQQRKQLPQFTDHHIQSPLNNIENSCFVCHRESTEDLVSDVYERQRKVREGTGALQRYLAKAHLEAERAWELGATQEQMADIQMGIRHAQWRWDYAVASHGAAFHAPLETSRIVTTALSIIQETRIELALLLQSLGQEGPVEMPDLNSKPALQAYVGIDIDDERINKERFLQEIVPRWLEEGREREAQMGVKRVND